MIYRTYWLHFFTVIDRIKGLLSKNWSGFEMPYRVKGLLPLNWLSYELITYCLWTGAGIVVAWGHSSVVSILGS